MGKFLFVAVVIFFYFLNTIDYPFDRSSLSTKDILIAQLWSCQQGDQKA